MVKIRQETEQETEQEPEQEPEQETEQGSVVKSTYLGQVDVFPDAFREGLRLSLDCRAERGPIPTCTQQVSLNLLKHAQTH